MRFSNWECVYKFGVSFGIRSALVGHRTLGPSFMLDVGGFLFFIFYLFFFIYTRENHSYKYAKKSIIKNILTL